MLFTAISPFVTLLPVFIRLVHYLRWECYCFHWLFKPKRNRKMKKKPKYINLRNKGNFIWLMPNECDVIDIFANYIYNCFQLRL